MLRPVQLVPWARRRPVPRRVRRRDDVPVTADVQMIVRGCDRRGGREQEGRGHGHVPVVVVVVIVLGRSAVRPVAGVRLVCRGTDFRGAASVVHRQRGAMLLLLLLVVLQVRLALVLLQLLLPLHLHRRLALLARQRLHGVRLLPLPHEDVVDHCAPTKHDAKAYENRRDDRRCRVKLDERVQYHTS